MSAQRRSQRGVALLLVLWACTLLAIMLGGYALTARTEGLQARFQFAQTQAHYAAEAGLARAVYGLQDPRLKQRWQADGRPYTFHFGDATVRVSAFDEGGKVDLNTASPIVLQGLFHAAGLRNDAAQKLALAVLDWRDFDPNRRVGLEVYAANGYQPRHAPFMSIEELQQVAGMTSALYRTLAGAITIWSGRESPDPKTAAPLALAAVPGMTPERVAQVMAARKNARPGVAALFAGNGVTHSIRSEATMADGTRAVLHATVRLQGVRPGAQPYAVLHWREGDRE
ncbi:general secretion pathway protein GspK [Frateuria sp. STR12]|uniref:general secretion pathway protein GspK n=1 Tax=Frateuria hangzhouensis TaxID=2995589 RepID=UPI002260A4EC|nr:type II secretion system protein GspK [Frateuria sp. STR12]MCX7512641.1 type II secretion system protein GspK [Frateuria sp. STR12]